MNAVLICRFLVTDHNNSTDTEWWNSEIGQAAHWDFTKPEVAQWYTEQLRNIQREHGIDTFKFDAGETSWTPPVCIGYHATSLSVIFFQYFNNLNKLQDPVLRSVPNLSQTALQSITFAPCPNSVHTWKFVPAKIPKIYRYSCESLTKIHCGHGTMDWPHWSPHSYK